MIHSVASPNEPPLCDPDGDEICLQIHDADTNKPIILLYRADPHSWLHERVLDYLLFTGEPKVATISFEHRTLTINAANGKRIYRIGDYSKEKQSYRLEWVD